MEGYVAGVHYACVKDEAPGVVRILLAQPGVDSNPRDSDGWTPVMYAVVSGEAECVRTVSV